MATSSDPVSSGDVAERRTFSTAFRGFDQAEVRAYLEVVAAEFSALRERVTALEAELEAARLPVPSAPLDVAAMTKMLGEETARVLQAAQQAADDLRVRAEEGAARTLSEAHEEAARVRGASESVLAERSAVADQLATQVRREAEERAAQLTHDAQAEADRTIAAAIEKGREMVGQAQAARERVLADLNRRRRSGLAQIEALRQGRVRLMESLGAVRVEVERVAADLEAADDEARLAAQAATPPAKATTPSKNGPVDAESDQEQPPTNEGPTPDNNNNDDIASAAGEQPSSEPSDAPAPPGAEPSASPPVASVAVQPPVPKASEPPERAEPAAKTEPAASSEPPESTEAAASSEPQPPPPEPAVTEQGAPQTQLVSAGTEDALAAEAALHPGELPGKREGLISVDQAVVDGVAEAGDAPHVPAPAVEVAASKAVSPPPERPAYRHDPVPAAVLPAAAVGENPADDEPPVKVDELFARIRADRAQATEEARTVLTPAVPGPEGSSRRRKERGPRPAEVPAVMGGVTASAAGSSTGNSVASRSSAAGPRPAGPMAAAPPAGDAEGSDAGMASPRTDAEETYLQRRDVLVEVVLAATVRGLRRSLADDQNAALDRFRTARTEQVDIDALLGEEKAQIGSWSRRAAAGLADGATAGATLAVGAGAPRPNAALVRPVADELARDLVSALRTRLSAVLEAAGKDRGPETVDRINGVYREWRGRIERAVGDAVTSAVSMGFAFALTPGTPVAWVVEDADGPCPDCDDNALAGATPLGDAFPTGQTMPPAHPGCRCVLTRAST